MNSTMKLSVRISDQDWSSLESERTEIRAMLRKILEHLSQEDRRDIRKLIENLLKGGEDLEEVQIANQAMAKGMVQQVVVILEGWQKLEILAARDANFESASVAIINHLVERLEDYLRVEMNDTDSEEDPQVSDPSAAGKDGSLQGVTPQGEKGVSEKDINDLFVIEEEEIESEGAGRPTAEERQKYSKIEQQSDPDGEEFGNMSTPQQRRSLTSDMMTETNNMVKATSKVVVKMNTLEEKVDQQVAMLERQLKGFKVHYLEGQKVVAQQAKEVTYRHQRMVEQVDKNTEQNGKIVGLLRELQDGVKTSAARAEAEMETCFEFAAKTDVDLKKSLGDSQDLYHRRHGEIRDELSSLRDIVQGLATHVQGLQPLQSAVDDPAPATKQAQEPAEVRTMQVLPNKEKLMKTFMKARKRMQTQRIFSELCKHTYRIKISKHDWCPEAGVGLVEPDERWKHYMAHGTSHGIGRAGKGKRDGHEVIPFVDKLSKDATTPAPTKRVVSAVAAGVEKERQRSQPQSKKQASSGTEEEASDSEDSGPSSPSTHGSSSDDEDKWCCNRRFRIEGKGRDWYRYNTYNDKGATDCQRCDMPRYNHDSDDEGTASHSTAGEPVDNGGQQIPPAVVVGHFIDSAAICSGGEEEWNSQDGGTPVEQVEDETDVALLPMIPLPDGHHLQPWMRPNLVRKAELALSVAEATRLAQLKPRDEARQRTMEVLIAQTREYQDLDMSPMHESMKKPYNESLTKTGDFALEVASAGGKTAAALRRYRWSQLEVNRTPYLVGTTKSAPGAWTPEAIVNFIRDPRVWQALLTADDCKVTQWHRRVEELMREPIRAGKRRSQNAKTSVSARLLRTCTSSRAWIRLPVYLQEPPGAQAAGPHDPEHPELLGGPG
jgi:hypothetical protein